MSWADVIDGAERVGFDGIYRPEPCFAPDHWRAVKYHTRLDDRGRRVGIRTMEAQAHRTEAEAQEHCDRLNGRGDRLL